MPNKSGPHSKSNPKTSKIPANITADMILGYTGVLQPVGAIGPIALPPTVYFTRGHFTQAHGHDWNVGWDSYEGWDCKFFGNVLESGDQSSHIRVGQNIENIPPDKYVQKLSKIGYNRFVGGKWDLSTRQNELRGHILREFWIQRAGVQNEDRFAHPSRNCFIPVRATDKATRRRLWEQIHQ
jgi:hypothetical protein